MTDVKSHPGESFSDRADRLEADNWGREADKGGGLVDFSNIRVTQLNFNKVSPTLTRNLKKLKILIMTSKKLRDRKKSMHSIIFELKRHQLVYNLDP